MADYPKYSKRYFRDQRLFEVLRAYIFFNAGKVLTHNMIATEIKNIFKNDEFKPSDDTISRFLVGMAKEGEIAYLKREYVKPQFTKTNNVKEVSISFGDLYYLFHDESTLLEIYESDYFRKISDYKSGKNKMPSFDSLFRKTVVCQSLCRKYGYAYDAKEKKVCSGAIVYHYNDDQHKDNKITVAADFLVTDANGQKVVYMVSGIRTWIRHQNDPQGVIVLNALLSLKRFAKVPVKFVTIWDNEPKSQNSQDIKKILSEQGYTNQPWHSI